MRTGTQASRLSLAVSERPRWSWASPFAALARLWGRRLPVWASGSWQLFLSTVRVSRTAARAAGSPSACAWRVREHAPPGAPGPPGGAKPGFEVG